MRTTGIVKWFDRRAGVGVVSLDDGGGDCVVRLMAEERGADRGPPRAADRSAPRTSWREDAPAIADAVRAGDRPGADRRRPAPHRRPE